MDTQSNLTVKSRFWTNYLLIGMFLMVSAACAKEPVNEQVDNPHAVLAEYQWVLSEITFRGEGRDITALYPTDFRFDVERGLLSVTTPCEGTDDLIKGIGYAIVFQDEQHYVLLPEDSSDVSCGEIIDAQTKHLYRIFDTTHYEIRGDQLFLIGNQIQIILNKDVANP